MSCSYFKPKGSTEHLARVNNNYLKRKEVIKALPKNISSEDSIVFVNNYINRWATQQLLLAGAKRNLPQKQQEEFETMIEQYRQDLYTEAYKDMIIAHKMDTVISDRALKSYFKKHRKNFTLKEDLVKLRYIKLAKNYPDSVQVRKQLNRFNHKDQSKLQQASLKFKNSSLNDSLWIRSQEVYNKLFALNNADELPRFKKDKFIHFSDSLSSTLIYIKDVRKRNEQAPLDYIKPTLKEILQNKRKLQFAKDFEKNITKDALEDGKYEILN